MVRNELSDHAEFSPDHAELTPRDFPTLSELSAHDILLKINLLYGTPGFIKSWILRAFVGTYREISTIDSKTNVSS